MPPLHSFSQYDQNEMQHDFFVMSCHWHQYHMVLMSSSMAHDTDASNNNTSGTKSHIIPLHNHQKQKCNGVTDSNISIM